MNDATRSPRLDRIDIAILSHLQRDGRISNVRLAHMVGLSSSPCLHRVKRLERAGYITGFGAQIELSKLTESITVFTEVRISDHRSEDFTKFEHSIREVPEVCECFLLSGGYDYLVQFLARNVTHYQAIIERLVDRNIGIEKYFSYIVLKPLVRKPPWPSWPLLAE